MPTKEQEKTVGAATVWGPASADENFLAARRQVGERFREVLSDDDLYDLLDEQEAYLCSLEGQK